MGLASASMGGMHTNLTVLSSLKVDKMIFMLGPHIFRLVQTRTYHGWTSNSLKTKDFLQTAPIIRTRFGSLAQKVDGLRPKKHKTINL